jgi:hypothetical protein
VDRNFIEHKLNIDPSVKSRKQKLRKMSDDKAITVKSEVQRLLDATVIREVMYPKWLANTVPVKKKNGKWRMCIDFTDLNKATPKDNYSLPQMDQVVDSAANVAVMSCWIASLGIISVGWRKRMRKKPVSSHPLEPSASYECQRV